MRQSDDILKRIFLDGNDKILIQISLEFVPRSPIDDKSALVQVMAWRRIGEKPFPEPMMTQQRLGCFMMLILRVATFFNARNADEVDDNGYETRKCERGEKGSAAINGNSNMNITVSYVHESCPD